MSKVTVTKPPGLMTVYQAVFKLGGNDVNYHAGKKSEIRATMLDKKGAITSELVLRTSTVKRPHVNVKRSQPMNASLKLQRWLHIVSAIGAVIQFCLRRGMRAAQRRLCCGRELLFLFLFLRNTR